jgi:hypothetical protein
MLADREFEAIAISPSEATAESTRRAIAAKLPVFTDVPPPLALPDSRRLLEVILRARTPIHFRLADFVYPASPADLSGWLNRNRPQASEARLVISHAATRQDLRVAAISAVDALFAVSDQSPEELLRWVGSNDAKIEVRNSGTFGILSLPANGFGLKELCISLLGAFRQKSVLIVQQTSGSLEIPVSSQSDANSSLQTAMKFLSSVRHPTEWVSLPGAREQIAAVFVDRFLGRVRPLR